LYSSAFKGGAFLGGTLAGVVAQYVGFSHVFSVCSGLAMLSGLLLLMSRTFVQASSEAST
jgi:SET family sugar efflux transporter-like MFS transporter